MNHPVEDPPPFLGAWKRVYAAVVVYLAACIALLYFFAQVNSL